MIHNHQQYDLDLLMKTIQKLSKDHKKKIIAIDGRCASGKTTLAKEIKQNFDCNIFHMDDFFLPFELKTEKRLAEPGGNVHYERAKTEVLEQLQNEQSKNIEHHPYNCQTRTFDSPVHTPSKQLNIIEGVYSMHPSLIKFYDFKVFLTVNKDVQLKRINNRSPEKLQMFIGNWIPMEEHYFKTFNLLEKSDLVIDTSNSF